MKEKLCIALFCLAGFVVSAQQVNFIDNNWAEARTRAAQENKLLFVDAYTDWCYWCKVMDKKTFAHPNIIPLLNENFVSLKLEMESGYGINVARKYQIAAFPSLLVFSPDGVLLYKTFGYQDTVQFAEFLNDALAGKNAEPTPGISKEVDIDFPQFYKDAFGKGNNRKFPEKEMVQQYLDAQTDWLNEATFNVVSKFTKHLTEAHTFIFLSNVKKYKSLFGNSNVQQVTDNIGYGLLAKAKETKDEIDLESCFHFFKKHKSDFSKDLENRMRIDFYESGGKWKEFGALVDANTNGSDFDYSATNEWSWAVYEKCEDKEVINKAIGWMEKVITKEKAYPQLDTYAALLYKAGRKKEGEKAALAAIEAGKKEGVNTKETVELMKKYGSKAPAK